MDDVIPSHGGAATTTNNNRSRASTPLAPGSVGLDIDEDTPSSSKPNSKAATATGPAPSQEDMFFMQQATEKVGRYVRCICLFVSMQVCLYIREWIGMLLCCMYHLTNPIFLSMLYMRDDHAGREGGE